MLPYDYQEVVNLLHKLKVNALQLADSTDCAEKSIQLASCPEDVTSTLSWFPGKAAGKLGIILSLLDQIDIRHAYPFSRCDDMTEEKPAEDVRVILTEDGPVSYTHLDVYKRQVGQIRMACTVTSTIRRLRLVRSRVLRAPTMTIPYLRCTSTRSTTM